MTFLLACLAFLCAFKAFKLVYLHCGLAVLNACLYGLMALVFLAAISFSAVFVLRAERFDVQDAVVPAGLFVAFVIATIDWWKR